MGIATLLESVSGNEIGEKRKSEREPGIAHGEEKRMVESRSESWALSQGLRPVEIGERRIERPESGKPGKNEDSQER
jgi:hypothetical protein